MPVTVSYDNPHLAKGAEVSINGVCAVPNGGSVEVDDETLALFEKANGRTLEDAFKKDKTVKIAKIAATKEKEVKDA